MKTSFLDESSTCCSDIRLIFRLTMTFGRELVIWLTKPSMFGKFMVHVWRWCGGLNKEHSISIH